MTDSEHDPTRRDSGDGIEGVMTAVVEKPGVSIPHYDPSPAEMQWKEQEWDSEMNRAWRRPQ